MEAPPAIQRPRGQRQRSTKQQHDGDSPPLPAAKALHSAESFEPLTESYSTYCEYISAVSVPNLRRSLEVPWEEKLRAVF